MDFDDFEEDVEQMEQDPNRQTQRDSESAQYSESDQTHGTSHGTNTNRDGEDGVRNGGGTFSQQAATTTHLNSNRDKSAGDDDDQNAPLFFVLKHNAKEMYQVVKCVAFREHCVFNVTNEGIRLSTDDQYNLQANIYLKREHFAEFNYNVVPDDTALFAGGIQVKVPVKPLLETLNIFTSNTTDLRIWWHQHGQPLFVNLTDEDICVQVEIRTLVLGNQLDIDYNNSRVVCKAIIFPHPVRELMHNLDDSAESIVITFTPNYLQFYVSGEIGKMKVEVPSTSEQLQTLNCIDGRVQNRYRMNLFKRMTEAIKLCERLSIRIDHRGVLSTQLLIPQNGQSVFAEFFIISDQESYYENEA